MISCSGADNRADSLPSPSSFSPATKTGQTLTEHSAWERRHISRSRCRFRNSRPQSGRFGGMGGKWRRVFSLARRRLDRLASNLQPSDGLCDIFSGRRPGFAPRSPAGGFWQFLLPQCWGLLPGKPFWAFPVVSQLWTAGAWNRLTGPEPGSTPSLFPPACAAVIS